MDNADFDPGTSLDREYSEDEPGVPRRTRRDRSHAGLLGRQVALIIGANAIVSLVISLVVVRCAAPGPVAEQPGQASPTAVSVAQAGDTGTPGGASTADGTLAAPTPTPAGAGEQPAQPTAARPAEPTTHIVQPGDTLSTIAALYKVSVEDLMKANGLDNPDYLMLGQKLIVPIGGMPIVTPTFTPAPVPTNTLIPFEPPTPLSPDATPVQVPAATILPTPTAVPTLTPVAVGEVRLTLEILNPADPVKEAAYISNQGMYVRLGGWTLSNDRDAPYTFPDFGLGGNGAAVNVHTGAGGDTATDLFWGRPATAWKAGDTATLRDPEGQVIVSTIVGAAATATP
jgi:LysM repeat protein